MSSHARWALPALLASLVMVAPVRADSSADAPDAAPSSDGLQRGDSLETDAQEPGAPLSLADAMQMAATNRIDVSVQAAAVDAARADRRRAGSAWLPHLEGRGLYARIDEDRAEASFGSQPEDRTTVGATLSQVVYSDDVLTARRTAGRAYEAQQALADDARLDAMASAALRYLDLLSARAVHRIDLENLKLTLSNLDLARVRHQVGTTGPEEVYRWEAQEARHRSAVIESGARVDAARNSLNQAIGLDQDTPWQVSEVALADDDVYFLGDRLRPYFADAERMAVLREFSVAEAVRHSPALQALDARLAAQRLVVASLRRQGLVPTLTASLTYDHVLDETFSGPSMAEAFGSSAASAAGGDTDDEEWVAALSASLPIFEGGGRMARVARARADLAQMEHARERERQSLELRTRIALHAVASSQPDIGLSRVAADRARKNLDVIVDKYANGSVPILDLLDAQNQARVEAQTAAIAVHRYLKSLVDYQRAVSWFDLNRTDAERDEWLRRLQAYENARTGGRP